MVRKFRPVRENIVVEVFNQEEVSEGGIIIQRAVHKDDMKREEGTIVAIGEHAFYDTDGCTVKVTDRVCFAKYAGKILTTLPNGNQIRVMKDIDLLCIIEDVDDVEESTEKRLTPERIS